ncbi:MAG: fibrinogen-like YCDxxxxGGGW domain-containing protein [Deltaproteobacteria bacterium]|nr:fibrinogen-like YCDxxxxGGGW domain-containing protein [Myxococcales bacterium]MDP3212886.1 fibrinogen-like YCDxxxxGGGW domain-containing protein [Deltaproteobacteria bacterium]
MRHLAPGLALALLATASCSTGTSVVGGALDVPTTDVVALDTAVADRPELDADAPSADASLDAPDAPADVPADAPFRCATNADCAGRAGPVCDVASGACVQCVPSADTCPVGQYCVAASNTCAPGCRDDSACSAASDAGTVSRRCDTTTRACVDCVTDDHCPSGNLCVGNLCVMGCNAGRACPSGQTCCSGGCVDTQSNTAACGMCDARCAVPNAAAACLNGSCAVGACTAPYADCNGSPTDGCEANTQTDVNRCGACGTSCPPRANAASACAAGVCAFTCDAGFADCNNDPTDGCEVDIRTSVGSCGRCGAACSLANATATCAAGTCAIGMCSAGFGDCDGNAPNGCETDTRTSVSHCGACGTACAGAPNAVPACANGACALTCTAGFAECDGNAANGCEVDTRSSATHCGGCGRTCNLPNATATCAGSLCAVGACATGFADCDGNAANGCEVDTRTSAAHCNGCGMACAFANAASSCAASACVLGACAAGFADCDATAANGCEVDTRSTVTSCGMCGRTCALANATAGCAAGACTVASCNAGFADCDGSPANGCEVDTRTSDAHCGMCGRACVGGNACAAGACGPMVSCAAIHARFPALASGVYSIDPDGAGAGAAPFDAYCDMTTEGGGWTLVATAHNSALAVADTRRWNTEAVFTDASTFGTVTARATDDYKSPGWNTVPGADFLVQTNEYYFGFRALLGAQGVGRFIATHPQWTATACATSWIRSGVDFASANLTTTARATLGLVLRGLDFNAAPNGCFPGIGPTRVAGGNENATIGFGAGPGWWVFGVGNTPNGFATWGAYDAGLFNLASTNSQSVTCNQTTNLPGNFPCNANNRWTVGVGYDRTDKVTYVQMLVR